MSYSEKYQQLENQIQELQKEVKRLKEEEAGNKLPQNFKIEDVKKVIDDEKKLWNSLETEKQKAYKDISKLHETYAEQIKNFFLFYQVLI